MPIFRVAPVLLLLVSSAVAISSEGWSISAVLVLAAVGLLLILPQRQDARPAAEPRPAAEATREEQGEAALADAISDPLFVLRDHRIVQANRAALDRFGDHLVEEDVRVALRHPGLIETLSDAVERQSPIAIDATGLGGAGVWWEARIAPGSDGRVVLHLVDRTAARAADRTRTDFVANASHELRTPLAAILGFVETLGEGAGEDPALRRKFLGVIGREAARMQQLVEDLLSLSRIESERRAAPQSPLALGALAKRVVAEARTRGLPAGRPLVLDSPDDPVRIVGDEAQLHQLITNLIDNAIKYGRADTPVRLAVTTAGTLAELTVRDEGDGIASEHLPRLTERFYRVDPGRSRRIGGTGLGLAIAKHIVERHRGTLRLQSVLGEGTTVTVRLPLQRGEA